VGGGGVCGGELQLWRKKLRNLGVVQLEFVDAKASWVGYVLGMCYPCSHEHHSILVCTQK
jgi:Rps23 Pro-64 3,4-dihydroxylase Tpa1-like proline 4-hydroxylase